MDWRATAAKDLADHCYSEPGLTLARLSRQIGLSSGYLGILFHRQSGQTFHAYLLAIRMLKARELLNDPTLALSEVAFRVGYNDTSNFCRAFRKKFGVTARTYSMMLQDILLTSKSEDSVPRAKKLPLRP